MRVPVTSQPQTTAAAAAAAQSLKPVSSPAPPPLCYEPTSVLDLRSPVSDKPQEVSSLPGGGGSGGGGAGDADDGSAAALQWDEHVLQTLDWDSIMRDLGLHDDSVPPYKANPHVCPSDAFPPPPPPHHHPHHHLLLEPPAQFLAHDFALSDAYPNPLESCADFPAGWNGVGPEYLDELIRAAECFESSKLQQAQVILARLNQQLRSPAGKPLQRAAFYFKEALQSLLLLQSGSNRATPARLSSWPDIVQTIRAYKAFSGNSPISMFTYFTAIQALLESLDDSMLFHVVDFDIGFGGQYASFMKEIAEQANSRKLQPPMLRITAVVPEEFAIETKLIRDNLSQFAHELKLRFDIDFVLVRAFEMLSFKSIRFVEGESLAVHLSPAILHRLGSATNVARFLGDVRRLNPSIVVFADTEPWADAGGAPASASFQRSFLGCFEHYVTVFESVDAAVFGGDWARKIEAYLLRPRIAAAVEAAARRAAPPWREAFHGAGMRAVRLSPFADYQADCLLRKVQGRGFRVAKQQAELVLYWQERALVATSAWRF